MPFLLFKIINRNADYHIFQLFQFNHAEFNNCFRLLCPSSPCFGTNSLSVSLVQRFACQTLVELSSNAALLCLGFLCHGCINEFCNRNFSQYQSKNLLLLHWRPQHSMLMQDLCYYFIHKTSNDFFSYFFLVFYFIHFLVITYPTLILTNNIQIIFILS